jgi:hypothetical protein
MREARARGGMHPDREALVAYRSPQVPGVQREETSFEEWTDNDPALSRPCDWLYFVPPPLMKLRLPAARKHRIGPGNNHSTHHLVRGQSWRLFFLGTSATKSIKKTIRSKGNHYDLGGCGHGSNRNKQGQDQRGHHAAQPPLEKGEEGRVEVRQWKRKKCRISNLYFWLDQYYSQLSTTLWLVLPWTPRGQKSTFRYKTPSLTFALVWIRKPEKRDRIWLTEKMILTRSCVHRPRLKFGGRLDGGVGASNFFWCFLF